MSDNLVDNIDLESGDEEYLRNALHDVRQCMAKARNVGDALADKVDALELIANGLMCKLNDVRVSNKNVIHQILESWDHVEPDRWCMEHQNVIYHLEVSDDSGRLTYTTVPEMEGNGFSGGRHFRGHDEILKWMREMRMHDVQGDKFTPSPLTEEQIASIKNTASLMDRIWDQLQMQPPSR